MTSEESSASVQVTNKNEITEIGKNVKNQTLLDLNFKIENESYTDNSLGDKVNERLLTYEDIRQVSCVDSFVTPEVPTLDPTSAKELMTSQVKNLVLKESGSLVDQKKTRQTQMSGIEYVGSTLKQKPKSNQRKRGILLIDKPISRRIKVTKVRSSQNFN